MTNLTSLGNSQLLGELKNLVASERNLTSQFLAYRLEVSERGLHLELGFQSLFEFCQSLGFSESCAYKRITAMGVLKRFPAAKGFIEDGRLHLSHLCQLAAVLTEENHLELFNQATGKSKRAVEILIDGLRAAPAQDVKPRCSVKMFKGPLLAISETATLPSSSAASSLFELSKTKEEPIKIQNDESLENKERAHSTSPVAELRLHCSEEFLILLERAKNLTHTPDAATEKLMIRVLKEFVERHAPEEKEKRATLRKERRQTTQKAATTHAKPQNVRFIPAAIKRQVTLTANARCSFVSQSGKRCGATRFLEIDHIRPVGLGGLSEPYNLRLLCRSHNRHKAKKDFGKEFIEAFYTRKT